MKTKQERSEWNILTAEVVVGNALTAKSAPEKKERKRENNVYYLFYYPI